MNFYSAIGKLIYPKMLWNVKGSESVYLTFDDGPHPTITPWVLDVLDQFNAKATFFVVGENAVRFPEVMRMIKDRGHGIGNHTYNHLNGWKFGKEKYLRNIEKCAEVLGEKGLFRPPFGRVNRKSLAEMSEYKYAMWSVLTKDYLPNLDLDHAFYRITRQTKRGAIVVFHDSEKANKNLKYLLPKYLEFLSEAQLKMEALPV